MNLFGSYVEVKSCSKVINRVYKVIFMCNIKKMYFSLPFLCPSMEWIFTTISECNGRVPTPTVLYLHIYRVPLCQMVGGVPSITALAGVAQHEKKTRDVYS